MYITKYGGRSYNGKNILIELDKDDVAHIFSDCASVYDDVGLETTGGDSFNIEIEIASGERPCSVAFSNSKDGGEIFDDALDALGEMVCAFQEFEDGRAVEEIEEKNSVQKAIRTFFYYNDIREEYK